MKVRTWVLAAFLAVFVGAASLAAQNLSGNTVNTVIGGETMARWLNTVDSGPQINLGSTDLAWGPGLDFSAAGILLTTEATSSGTATYELQGEATDTYEILAMPDGDVTGGHFSWPPNGHADAVTTTTDETMLCERLYLPMWLTVANVYVRGVVGADSAADDTVSFAIYEDADAGAQLTEATGADLSATANVTLNVTDVTLGPGMYRMCGCAQDVSGAAFHAATRDDETIDVINLGAVTFGTAANVCVAGNPPATTGALTTADDNAIVFKLGG